MIELKSHFKGTYAKNLMADWPLLTELIQKQTMWVKDTTHVQGDSAAALHASPLLNDRHINDALNGPFQPLFREHLSAYADIVKVETALTLSKDELFKESEHEVDITLGLSEQLLSEMDFSILKDMRDALNEHLKTHHAALEALIQTWTETLLSEFKKNNLALSDLEIQEFSTNQPISELNDRFINWKVSVPKLDKAAFNFQQYYALKITLTLHSALSRTQQPNTEKDIEQLFKPFQPVLKAITKAENEWLQTQKNTLAQLVSKVSV